MWDVLVDPTRREIVQRLAAGDLTAGEIASAFEIARPGVSRHLRVLREAGLVEAHPQAQRRVYRLRPEALAPIDAWRHEVSAFWEQRLDALATEVARGTHARTRTTTTGAHDDRATG
ncbi:ArsR family transcriptional regulator [Nocardioides mangrovicus]|uniref:ArsR family transcriptional regulator n=1 Tax=Nocardioides mangrovicus TaxID=2478913 RepID=A0A3L8P4E3_9ACTN|nr:ArsR family transcriptional regulator [Nocardioides mangrovicus]